jgi:hypothetical protein
VWYLGGELAESGVKRSPEAQIKTAQEEVQGLFPWIDWSTAQWATLRVNRAEPKQSAALRPDMAFCHPVDRTMVCWPTKLALSPNLAQTVIEWLQDQPTDPLTGKSEITLAPLPAQLPRPEICRPFWEGAFDA